jgi:predicted O-linked N-acetylglucosamine transferase (SPINDLY family)
MAETASSDLTQLEMRWQRANMCAASGDPAGALEIYRALAEELPDVAPLWRNIASVQNDLGQVDEAIASFRRASAIDPFDADAQAALGRLFSSLGRHGEANQAFSRAIEIDPADVSLKVELCRSLFLAGADETAEETALQALEQAPGSPDLLFMLGGHYLECERHEQAADLLGRAYRALPHPMIANSLAQALCDLKRQQGAADLLQEAITRWPDDVALRNQLGAVELEQGRLGNARETFRRALAMDPNEASVKQNLARCLIAAGAPGEALGLLEELLDGYDDKAKLMSEMATACYYAGNWDDAETLLRRAIDTEPENPVYRSALAEPLIAQQRFGEAEETCRQALAIDPELGSAHFLLAAAVRGGSEDFDLTRRHLETALAFADDDVQLLSGIAGVYESIKDAREAIEVYQQVVDLEPENRFAHSRLFDLKLTICDWDRYDDMCEAQIAGVKAAIETRDDTSGVDVFNLQALPVSYAFTALAAKTAAANIARRARKQTEYPPLRHHNHDRSKIRVGYALAYTHLHSLPLVHKRLVEAHDRDRFEVYGYSIKPCDHGEFSRAYRAAFDNFRDLSPFVPYESARRIFDDGIDILVDVTGLTAINCMQISSFRPAPVQVHAYGYSITTGADYIDYLITDRTYIPPEWQQLGSEKLVYLPGSFMPACAPVENGMMTSRQDNGLPEDGIVFCNFNHPCKFEPTIFAAWMDILRGVPGSVLWFGSWANGTRENLRAQAERHDVAPERLIFSDVVAHADHLARLGNADLALDNLHHGGGITSLDALWCGVPLLTILGETPASRLGASLLEGLDAGDLILPDLEAFKQTAIELAGDDDKRHAIRDRLLCVRHDSGMFDIVRHTRHLEAGFEEMWKNHLNGNLPAQIDVAEIVTGQVRDKGSR